MKNTGKILFVIPLLFCQLTSATVGRFLPFSGFYPIPRKTPEPINIVSKHTYSLHTKQPITFEQNDKNGQIPAFIRNTESSVQVFLINSTSYDIIQGGPLYNNKYRFRRAEFYWTDNTNGVAYTTVNGRNGSALEVAVVYVNLKYRTLTNAQRYRDGVAEILFRIQIGSKPNPKFEPFAKVMKTIRKPGPPKPIKLRYAFQWFDEIPEYSTYFVYPGSLTDETTGEIFYCTTTIAVDPNPTQFISKKQFDETFVQLSGKYDEPLTNQKKQYPRKFRPVARGIGIKQINT